MNAGCACLSVSRFYSNPIAAEARPFIGACPGWVERSGALLICPPHTASQKHGHGERCGCVRVFSRSEWIKRWMLFSSAQVRTAELFVRNFQRDRWAVRCHPCCLRLWSVLTAQLSFVANWMRVCEENTNERSSASSAAAAEGHSRAHRSSTAHRGFSALHSPNLRIFLVDGSEL